MLDLFKQNKWLFLLVGVLIAGFAWYGLSERQPEALISSDPVGGSGTSAAQSAAEREIVNTLLELRSIRLDGQIFNDPAFQSLRDFSTEIVSEPVGRDNPFAPLEEVSTESAEEASAETQSGAE